MQKVTRFKLLRFTTAQRTATTILKGELVYDKDLKKCFVGDGITLGGIDLAGGLPPQQKRTITANSAATPIDDVIICDNTGNITLTLPPAMTLVKELVIIQANIGQITLVPNGAETIIGSSNLILKRRYTSVSLVGGTGVIHVA